MEVGQAATASSSARGVQPQRAVGSDAMPLKDQKLPEGWGRGTTNGIDFIFELPLRQKQQAEAEYQREVNIARNKAAMNCIGVGDAVNDMKCAMAQAAMPARQAPLRVPPAAAAPAWHGSAWAIAGAVLRVAEGAWPGPPRASRPAGAWPTPPPQADADDGAVGGGGQAAEG
jgi:hypothetical protein